MMHTKVQFAGLVMVAALVAGCQEEKIKVYDVPKPRTAASGHKAAVPAGWEEGPRGEMRLASYIIKGTNGGKAEVSIIPLANGGGSELDNVNRWRSAVGQKGLTQEELTKSVQTVRVGNAEGRLYEMVGASTETDEPTRTVGVIVNRNTTGWFFKLSGDDKLVAGQKEAFLSFLQKFNFDHGHAHEHNHDHAEAAGGNRDPHAGLDIATAAPTPEGGPPQRSWPAPPSWQQQTPGMMQDAKFSAQGGKAVVTVSEAGGGMAANINRWRGQIGMSAVADAEAEKEAANLDLGSAQAKIVDLTGPTARMVVVIVPKGGTSVFYKLMGEPAAVAAEKDALVEFVKKIK